MRTLLLCIFISTLGCAGTTLQDRPSRATADDAEDCLSFVCGDVECDGWIIVRADIDEDGKAIDPWVSDSCGEKTEMMEPHMLEQVRSTTFAPNLLGAKNQSFKMPYEVMTEEEASRL